MTLGTLLTFIFIGIFAVSAIKRALETASQEAQKRAPQGRDSEARPSEVEEFLRSLQQARRRSAVELSGQQAPTVPGAPAASARPVAPAGPAAPPARAEEEVLLWQAPAAARSRRAAAPAVRPVRVRRPPKPADDAVETLVAREPVKELPPPEPPSEVVAPAALKKVGLREALIWSEILSPPLSVRRRRGRTARGGRP